MYKVGVFPGKFFPPHRGHLNAIIHAATQCEKLYVVVSDNPDIARRVCEECSIKELPLHLRARWMAQELKAFDHIKVVILDETGIPSYPDGTVPWSKKLLETIPEKFNAIFGGELEYRETYMKNFPEDINYVIYDYNRSRYHLSGTKVRDNPFKYWDYILGAARHHFVKRILITGTESCGKTTLSQYLAKIYHTSWTAEYGRMFIDDELGGCDQAIVKDDFLRIAQLHRELEEEALRTANRLVFIDSDAVVTQYYCKVYAGMYCEELERYIDPNRYDVILLFQPSTRWVSDGQRFISDSEERWRMHRFLKELYRRYDMLDKIIECPHDTYKRRLDYVIRMVDTFLLEF
jgi:HTH-type transcriptional regulator, transcriptional repressor of NAD biosynthesis genes